MRIDIKVVVVLVLIAILFSLGKALLLLNRRRDGENSVSARESVARALTWRVGLSIALFFFLLLAFRLGIIPGYSSQ